MDKQPSDLYIPNSQKNQTMYPSKPTKPNVSASSHRPKPQPIKMHSSRPTKPQEPLRESVEYNQISNRPRPCDGECVSGLFALLCDEVDGNAYCENEGSCCVTSETVQPTSPRPVSFLSSIHTFNVSFKTSDFSDKINRHNHQNVLAPVC